MDTICCKMDIIKQFVLLFGLLVLNVCESTGDQRAPEQVCIGSQNGLIHAQDSEHRYAAYKHTYENCTFVDGNLEIVFLEDEDDYDLSFLSDITEVTGYVLISNVYAQYVPLTSLRIIRGRQLFRATESGQFYSLFVSLNYKPGSKDSGIKELQFKNLYEIINGNVVFFNNNLLCYVNTIRWDDILVNVHQNVTFHSDTPEFRDTCEQCHPDCKLRTTGQRHCWGNGLDMCQTFSLILCADQCDGRCFGELPNQCCSIECAAGCTGPRNTECFACKHFNNDGVCVPFCPPENIYDPNTFQVVPNPDAKYSHGYLCVDQCPAHLVIDSGSCVSDCGPGRIPNNMKNCVNCIGHCPKMCDGTKNLEFINSANIKNFTGCNIIKGNIRILSTSFTGDLHNNIPAMHPSELSALESVTEINGHLMIQGDHEDFKSLGFFKNLKTIHGRSKDHYGNSFSVIMTGLESFDFTQKLQVLNENIMIYKNTKLCYVSSTNMNWRQIMLSGEQQIRSVNNKNESECRHEGHVCSSQCTEDGCWGAGENHCLSCRNYIMNGRCVESCDLDQGWYDAGDRVCQKCHNECSVGGCTGPNADHCLNGCKHFQDGPYCVAICPEPNHHNMDHICNLLPTNEGDDVNNDIPEDILNVHNNSNPCSSDDMFNLIRELKAGQDSLQQSITLRIDKLRDDILKTIDTKLEGILSTLELKFAIQERNYDILDDKLNEIIERL